MKLPQDFSDPNEFSHNELIRHLANNPGDERAWVVFVERYDDRIRCAISRQVQRLRYAQNLSPLKDLAQQVYCKLLVKNCKALREFDGRYDNSIFKYLEVIAIRIVLTDFLKATNGKNSPERGFIAFDGEHNDYFEEHAATLKDLLPDDAATKAFDWFELRDEVEYHLRKILKHSRHTERDGRVFRYRYFIGLEPEQIGKLPDVNLSYKRVMNILNEIIKELKRRMGGGENGVSGCGVKILANDSGLSGEFNATLSK